MSDWLGQAIASPALALFFAALLVAVTPRLLHGLWLVGVPAAALALLFALPEGMHGTVSMFGHELSTLRVDGLSRLWGAIFLLSAALTGLYGLNVKDRLQHVASLLYAGSAVGAVLAGDLVTLFLFWEGTAISSVFLIWARRTVRAHIVGVRYLIIQVISGLLLMVGTIIHQRATGSIAFNTLGLDSAGGWLIFLSFGIKAGFPLLHNWIQDAYPEATVYGTVVLSIFTTKLAIYALARGFAGTDLLIPIGAVMTIFPLIFALIENDLRRVLAYCLNNQLGFMVVAIGIGTPLALNGAAAHAVAHILYKGLLFMTMGAVLYRVGTVKASQLGGLYRSMPATTVFCIVGAMASSAVPLFSAFVSKSMIQGALGYEHMAVVWVVLLVAAGLGAIVPGIKVPFFAFFHRDRGYRVKEAPFNMQLAMGATALLCIAVGVFPGALYALLPYEATYNAYTLSHVINQLQLLAFAALAFVLLYAARLFPANVRGLNLDTDWAYRRALPALVERFRQSSVSLRARVMHVFSRNGSRAADWLASAFGLGGAMARTWTTGVMLLWVIVLLALYLVIYY
ncbi:Na(+)/H(+) antiporter subunit D [Salinisphaera sp. Q1T1-3]|uniref:Na(+)/H(+) antiporter subunit D n=1 Tax=Salinisphaera sp. Q1T1-3 TaxID=2321229 RepID=UPI000E7458A3|nr:Na(+)/H(+) antiporter subunit D [Salinisphaera sp. Q1T1-3]RJS93128.1 Na(+)/H(+) antiporter subunit D [Salinisphaera sp. Q1T1-3]